MGGGLTELDKGVAEEGVQLVHVRVLEACPSDHDRSTNTGQSFDDGVGKSGGGCGADLWTWRRKRGGRRSAALR